MSSLEDKWLNAINVAPSITAKVIDVTPSMAAAMLERNDTNRPLLRTRLAKYVLDMRNGRWGLNGEPVIISDDFMLNDGQHRLHAVVETGLRIPMLVVFGVKRASRTTVDQGANRSAGDYLGMDGVKNAKCAAGIARIVLAYEAADGAGIGDASRITAGQQVERVEADEQMRYAADFATRYQTALQPFVAPATFGAAVYIARRANPKVADSFILKVAKGAGLQEGDPAFAVRNALVRKGKTLKADKREILLRGFLAEAEGRKLSVAPVTGTLPNLGGVTDRV